MLTNNNKIAGYYHAPFCLLGKFPQLIDSNTFRNRKAFIFPLNESQFPRLKVDY